ncbi:malto-oligosyltrehalose trehalohydrolase [Limnoraphis robusta Tam1]|uniref:Malto-oligosyltrehalose trehalohydrolase n=1 Tax=Limnoraphis robusta CCNP1315 TaxID=3110306 RepID=A0ABU5TRS4_9CYAN|nr:malto-oligosyltrehalose trehalohydrolase [Limnoraphis robusta]MEA5517615.1 malto-oligosyltrehalose trehalohydrolase [Limnoraphis robusta CCNP1315]MEA5541355.1 malto-oligosyltrehalose trehalohydrolase [Limnoraphis robusta Tam1]MEA5544583.1 malto-oligosyltrehalose trehalohydrolase [Limnoraphis robusta CCNP1324]
MKVGANYLGDRRCEFTVWAPLRQQVSVQILTPQERLLPMEKDDQGYWHLTATEVSPGSRYQFQLDGEMTRPDPASHYQPDDVHKPSAVVDHVGFQWTDENWQVIPLEDLIIYELHVGTFTPEGTFEAIINRVPELLEMGINTIEIMPVAQFPGSRNWGYDGVYPYGVQASYGGPEGLKRLVDACHQQGMMVVLDVVYNHLGPEGNYTSDFGPYFTGKYNTPWGRALNFDDAYSPGVRNFFVENVLYWFRDYHIDGLRLDAVHAIYDFGAKHILEEMADETRLLSQQLGRPFYLIAESDLNDVRIIKPKEQGGYGLDGQWSDDFHHCVHTLLTGETTGYYLDFGKCELLEKTLREGFAYAWNYSANRQRYHGNFAGDRPASQFVVCIQNHDQVGNRMLGERISQLASFEGLKLGAATLIFSPFIPMLFMGEEYGEESPFAYFISHSDPDLVAAVRKGRKEEFEAFHAEGDPPDAQSAETFNDCVLKWHLRTEGKHKVILDFYRKLIQLRREIPALKNLSFQHQEVKSWETEKIVSIRRWSQDSQVFCILNFNSEAVTTDVISIEGNWQKRLDSTDEQWMGNGASLPDTLTSSKTLTLAAESFVLYECK